MSKRAKIGGTSKAVPLPLSDFDEARGRWRSDVQAELGQAADPKNRSGIEADRERLYALFPVLKERSRQQAATLSGGEQQMVALARALVARPKLLLLDEPSLGIAPIIMQQIFASLAELKSSGVTMLLVEQNMSMALDLADRAYVLRTGKVSLEGDARELKTNYEEVAAAYLGASR